jgi:hypothetical protein
VFVLNSSGHKPFKGLVAAPYELPRQD